MQVLRVAQEVLLALPASPSFLPCAFCLGNQVTLQNHIRLYPAPRPLHTSSLQHKYFIPTSSAAATDI